LIIEFEKGKNNEIKIGTAGNGIGGFIEESSSAMYAYSVSLWF